MVNEFTHVSIFTICYAYLKFTTQSIFIFCSIKTPNNAPFLQSFFVSHQIEFCYKLGITVSWSIDLRTLYWQFGITPCQHYLCVCKVYNGSQSRERHPSVLHITWNVQCLHVNKRECWLYLFFLCILAFVTNAFVLHIFAIEK